jgi:hypothetical protein
MENEELILNEDIEPTPEPEPFVIPLIYNYKADTKEFTGVVEQADKDNAKSAQVGHFVPMVHANATLLEPPVVEENQTQVYSKTVETHEEPYEVIDPETGESYTEYRTVEEVIENWSIEPDYRKNFYKVDNDLNVFNITTIGEQEGYIIVDKATGEDIEANKGWYKIVDNEVVKKSKKEYEQEQANRREAEFNKAFFNTSLGYIRRKVTMQDGSKKDFLGDLLLPIKAGLELGQEVIIIAYDKPDFMEDVTNWEKYQHVKKANAQFISECLNQIVVDFGTN